MLSTPIVLFAFKRPELTKVVFESIRSVRPTTLFLICDGPRPLQPIEEQLTVLVRKILDGVDWPCQVHRIYSSSNLGLRQRILTGLDEVFSKVDEAIVLEDDCAPSQTFYEFAGHLLEHHRFREDVGVISGFNFAPYRSLSSYHFSSASYIWGWATWGRVWRSFRSSPQVETWSQSEIDDVRKCFSSRSQAREFATAMRDAVKLNTWDISFVSWLLQSRLKTIVPHQNLVENIGFGEGATHTKFEAFDVQLRASEIRLPVVHPKSDAINVRREQVMWHTKRLRWITYPLAHPISFLGRFARYFRLRRDFG